MRSVYAKVLTAGLMVLAASPAFSQPPPRPGGPGGGFQVTASMLLRNDKVLEELKLTDDQKADVKKASDKVAEKFKADIEKARADRDFAKMGEVYKAQNEETEKAVLAVLKPEQGKRLKQIEVQAANLNAFTREDVQSALKLTDAQTKEIKESTKDLQDDIQEVFKEARGDQEKMAAATKKVQGMRTDTMNKIVASLADDQKKTWKDLTGDKFEVALGGPGGFGPGGFPGGPGGPGGPGAFGAFQMTASMLLRNDKVQEELKLTDDQKTGIKTAGDKIREKYKDDMDKARADMDFKKIGDLQKAQGEDMEKALAGVIKSEQSKRLKQIEVQAASLNAFSREDVKTALKLTDKQTKSIDDAKADVQKSIADAFASAQGDREKMAEAFKKVQTAGTDALDKIVAGLSDDQKKTWKDLTGDKFEVSFGPPGGPRPGPRQ